MSEKIEAVDQDKEVKAVQVWVKASGLPRRLSQIDSGAFGTTALNLEVLGAIVSAGAAAVAAARLPRLDDEGPYYNAFIFASESLDRLCAIGDGPQGQTPKGSLRADQYKDFGKKKGEQVVMSVLEDCGRFLEFYAGHPESGKRVKSAEEALTCLRSYFSLLSSTLKKLGPEKPSARLETPRLRYDGWAVAPREVGGSSGLLEVSLDDIVGNEDYLKAGRRLVRDVAGFDPRVGKNPKKVRNQILFVLGSPGCGKTVSAHALLRYFKEICEEHGLPARTRVIRRTDWASSYQNQSANRLLEIFREEVFEGPGVCGAYWPDIDTAFSARGSADLRQEEKSNLGTLFGILDGTIGPKNGKWFLICDANTMTMDDAMVSRLAQTPLQAFGPQTVEDFVTLLRDIKLRGKKDKLPISDEEWLRIGKSLVEAGLSGRSVDAVAGRVLTAIEDFDEPDEYFAMDFEAKQKVLAELSNPIPAETIHGFIEHHMRFEKEAQEKGEKERFARRVEEIRLHLSAQRAALAPDVESR